MVEVSNVINIAERRSTSQAYSCYKKKNYDPETHQSFDEKLSPILSKGLSEVVDRKPSSLNKEEKKKIFYSQNYMDIFAKPI